MLIRQLQPSWAIMMSRLFALLLVISLIYLLFFSNVFIVGRKGAGPATNFRDLVRDFVRSNANASRIRESSKYLTLFDHMAGTKGSYVLGEYVQDLFKESRLEDVHMEQFDVYLNYPKQGGRRVAIIEPPELFWEALIEEEQAYGSREQTMVFHGHSKSGKVKGPLVYANYGSRDDFKRLENHGIDIRNSIALVRYYGSQSDRALKVKAAELAGAVGCIIYSDPAEDGFFLQNDTVQRGAVSLMSWIAGDVLSSGFASFPQEERRDSKDENPGLVNIPSIPLSWRDAQKLLQALKGHGMKLEDHWKGAVPEVDEWWTGDAGSPIILLENDQEEVERNPIYNVLGKITGTEQSEKSITVGNHRDAWCFGAADPGSGTAVMLEVVRIFGELGKTGWRPLRTIEFASWDGEEYNLIGSTEHVEGRLEEIRRNGFAYLNVDVAVSGSNFEASASPLLQTALLHVLERVVDPMKNKTLRAVWAEKGSKLGGLGAGSDYVAFQDIAGTSSLDMTFTGGPYAYHSCYDNFEWMDEVGDPGFVYHETMAQIWALLILELADTELLPFDFLVYAQAVTNYVDDLQTYANAQDPKTSLNLTSLHQAADDFTKNAAEFHAWNRAWEDAVGQGYETNEVAIRRMSHNTRMARFETNLLDIGGGLPGREQFVHVIFAPQAWSGYEEAYFPGVRDAIENDDWELAQLQVEKVAGRLSYASHKLNH